MEDNVTYVVTKFAVVGKEVLLADALICTHIVLRRIYIRIAEIILSLVILNNLSEFSLK